MPVPPSLSPVRKRLEVSGRLISATPVRQLVLPEAAVDTLLTMQTLVGVLAVFGAGSGGPKRQPGAEQVRWLTAVMLVPPGSATEPRVMLPVVPLQERIDVKVRPWSGTVKGSGTVFPPPPV